MTIKEQTETRRNLYEIINDTLNSNEQIKSVEPINGGLLLDLGNNDYATIGVVIKDPMKFDVTKTRAEYKEKVDKAKARAEAAKDKSKG